MKQEHVTMKQLPRSERPYEKCEKYGAAYLTDAELLSVIIRTGTENRRSVDLAIDVLNAHKVHKGLIGLHYVTYPDLLKIDGIGKVKATQILCIAELTKRLVKEERNADMCFRHPKEIAAYFMEELRTLPTENVFLLMFDSKSMLLHSEKISTGTINSSVAAPREMFKVALQYDAVSIILLHNHPSGNPKPSRDDVSVTKRMQKCGTLMGIPLLDHIIIGDRKYVSMKEQGYF